MAVLSNNLRDVDPKACQANVILWRYLIAVTHPYLAKEVKQLLF